MLNKRKTTLFGMLNERKRTLRVIVILAVLFLLSVFTHLKIAIDIERVKIDSYIEQLKIEQVSHSDFEENVDTFTSQEIVNLAIKGGIPLLWGVDDNFVVITYPDHFGEVYVKTEGGVYVLSAVTTQLKLSRIFVDVLKSALCEPEKTRFEDI